VVYTTGWIEKNMGITTETLESYEKHGYVVPTLNPNNNKYRQYTEEQLKEIWEFKMLMSIGMTHKDLKKFMNQNYEDFDFVEFMDDRIESLERKRNRYEALLGHARIMKAFGRVPVFPEKMGSIKFEDYLQECVKNFNANEDDVTKVMCNFLNDISFDSVEKLDRKIIESLDEEKVLQLFSYSSSRKILLIEIIKNMHKGYDHQDVQDAVNNLYEYDRKHLTLNEPKSLYGNHMASQFSGSDIAYLYEISLGKENCEFISDALIFYGEINENAGN